MLMVSADRPWPAARLAWTAAILLAAGNSLSFIDRTILTLLVEPIKADLQISDVRISLLSGFSFTVFYVLVGIPAARLADHGNRRNVIALAILTWSTMTVACGLAWNFLGLALARAGTGAGEGALSPASQSILADYFPKERLPIALGLFSSGIYIGSGTALLVGGAVIAVAASAGDLLVPILGELKPWQVVFVVVGAPGVVLAALMFTVTEPVRRSFGSAGDAAVPLRAVWAHIQSHRASYIGLFGTFSLLVMQGYGSSAWIPAFFERRFHWSTAQVGTAYGAVVLVFGTLGALTGGLFANRLRRRGFADANVRTIRFGFFALTPFALLFGLAPDPYLALALVAGMNFFAGFPFAGGYAAVQELTPNRMRAQMAALLVVCVNVIGGGFGPTLVALFTDLLFGDPARLPYSLALAACITLPAAYLFIRMLGRSSGAPRGITAR